MKITKAPQIGTILEQRVGWTLRCNMYCLDHPPEDLTRSEKRDLVELFSGRPAAEWSGDECDDCKRTLGEVVRGGEPTGATIRLSDGGQEVSITVTLCEIPRDVKKLRRILLRVARFVVTAALRNGDHATASSDLEAKLERENDMPGYLTKTVSVEVTGSRITEKFRARLGEKLREWGLRSIEFDPPLAVKS